MHDVASYVRERAVEPVKPSDFEPVENNWKRRLDAVTRYYVYRLESWNKFHPWPDRVRRPSRSFPLRFVFPANCSDFLPCTRTTLSPICLHRYAIYILLPHLSFSRSPSKVSSFRGILYRKTYATRVILPNIGVISRRNIKLQMIFLFFSLRDAQS